MIGIDTNVQALLDEPMFGFEIRAAAAAALAAYEAAACGFADCLILAKNRAMGCAVTVTFDLRLQSLDAAVAL